MEEMLQLSELIKVLLPTRPASAESVTLSRQPLTVSHVKLSPAFTYQFVLVMLFVRGSSFTLFTINSNVF